MMRSLRRLGCLILLWPLWTWAASTPPDLDLAITYTSRVLTQEGVLREARYEEAMLRRAGHVWNARVLPGSIEKGGGGHPHRSFNPVTTPRHIALEGGGLRVEFIDAHEKEIVSIAAAEYENVGFDGSWANAVYLVDPEIVARLPLSERASGVAGARWRELEVDGVFQRVLWDERRMIPLVVETGDVGGRFMRRVEVRVLPGVREELPWENLRGYARKEYADFLD